MFHVLFGVCGLTHRLSNRLCRRAGLRSLSSFVDWWCVWALTNANFCRHESDKASAWNSFPRANYALVTAQTKPSWCERTSLGSLKPISRGHHLLCWEKANTKNSVCICHMWMRTGGLWQRPHCWRFLLIYPTRTHTIPVIVFFIPEETQETVKYQPVSLKNAAIESFTKCCRADSNHQAEGCRVFLCCFTGHTRGSHNRRIWYRLRACRETLLRHVWTCQNTVWLRTHAAKPDQSCIYVSTISVL